MLRGMVVCLYFGQQNSLDFAKLKNNKMFLKNRTIFEND